VKLGVISDTHGLLRSEAMEALAGVSQIIHAGDIGNPEILTKLERIAPVTAVRGNMDWGGWTKDLPENAVLEIGPLSFYVLHDLEELDLNPAAAGFAAVVTGHTHMPEVREAGGILYLNPGSAGPMRGSKPVSLALVEVTEDGLVPKIVELI